MLRAARRRRPVPAPLDGIPAALRRVFGDGRVVVLTDGPDNSAYWEHDWIAERARAAAGRRRPTSSCAATGCCTTASRSTAVYRRTNADELDTEVGALLQPVLRAGGVKLVNCFGTGVADDKLAHAYVARHDPLLPRRGAAARPGGDVRPRRAATLERALDVFDELVIKDRGSYGGIGVVICPHAERADVEALRERVRAAPGRLHRPAPGRALDASDRDRRDAVRRATSTCDPTC